MISPFTVVTVVIVRIYFISRTFTTLDDDLFLNLLKFIYLFVHISFSKEG